MRTLRWKRWTATTLFLFIPLALPAQDKEIKALAGTLAESLNKTAKKTVAVVDFTDLQSNATELGRYLAEEISVALAGSGAGIEVVDRGHLKALLQENKLAGSGVIDPATAIKLGKIAGVDVLVTGTITPFGDSVRFSVKALDTTTARIVTAFTTEIAKTRAIEELLNRGIAAGPSAGGGNPETGAPPRPTALTIKVQQFSFTLQSCTLEGGSVICSVTVRNESDADRNLMVYDGRGYRGYSRLIDGEGRQTNLETAQLGGAAGRATMVSGVATNLQLRFDAVPSNISSIALLEIRCFNSGAASSAGDDLRVQFRGVPVVTGPRFGLGAPRVKQ